MVLSDNKIPNPKHQITNREVTLLKTQGRLKNEILSNYDACSIGPVDG